MSNIGAGETYNAWLIKREYITLVDSLIKTSATETDSFTEYTQPFRFRYLTSSEMTFQPISAHLKGRYDRVIFTSELDLEFRERDKILFEDNTTLIINRAIPQKQHGMFLISKKTPIILELS